MRIEPFRIFFGLALVSLISLVWIVSPWMGITFFYAALTAWLWNLAPLWFQSPLPKVTELFPVVMLILFMMVLGGAPRRTTSEALFFTAASLVLFRGIIFLLLRIRNSKKEIPTMAKVALIAFLFEMTLNAIQVYATFRFVPESVLTLSKLLSIKAMMVILATGWLIDRQFKQKERTTGAILLVGVLGNPYLAGGMLIAHTIAFLKGRGFQYQDE